MREEEKIIQEKLKSSLEKYEIKTTSKMIENKFVMQPKVEKIEKKKKRFNFKVLVPTLTFAFSCVLLFVVIKDINFNHTPTNSNSSYQSSNSITSYDVSFTDSLPNNVKLLSSKEASTLSYQTVSSLVTLTNHTFTPLKFKNQISEASKNKIEELLPTIDLLVNNASFKTVIKESDLEEYYVKQEITYLDLTNNSNTFFIYYNVSDTENEVKSNDVEIVSSLQGIIIFDDQEFAFEGQNEIEKEKNEEEEELKLKIYVDESKANYLNVKQEIEKEIDEIEEEYKYEVYENNSLVSYFALEKENKKQNEESEIKLLLDDIKYSFEFYKENDDEFIKVKIEGDKNSQEVIYKKIITFIDEEEVAYFQEI